MIRLHFVVEGQTEETFVNTLLCPHLGQFNVSADARRVEMSPGYRGGLTSYARAKRDLSRWMKQDQHSDARFTSMFDLYALPADFPQFAETASRPPLPTGCRARVSVCGGRPR